MVIEFGRECDYNSEIVKSSGWDVVVVAIVMVRVRSGHCGEDGDMTVVPQQVILCCSDDGVKSEGK